MEITTVHYQKLVNLGEYENQRVGAWANVDAEETAEQALEHLTEWVLGRIDTLHEVLASVRREEEEVLERREQLRQLNIQIDAAQRRWEKIVKWFADKQIDLPARWSYTDDIPF